MDNMSSAKYGNGSIVNNFIVDMPSSNNTSINYVPTF